MRRYAAAVLVLIFLSIPAFFVLLDKVRDPIMLVFCGIVVVVVSEIIVRAVTKEDENVRKH